MPRMTIEEREQARTIETRVDEAMAKTGDHRYDFRRHSSHSTFYREAQARGLLTMDEMALMKRFYGDDSWFHAYND